MKARGRLVRCPRCGRRGFLRWLSVQGLTFAFIVHQQLQNVPHEYRVCSATSGIWIELEAGRR